MSFTIGGGAILYYLMFHVEQYDMILVMIILDMVGIIVTKFPRTNFSIWWRRYICDVDPDDR